MHVVTLKVDDSVFNDVIDLLKQTYNDAKVRIIKDETLPDINRREQIDAMPSRLDKYIGIVKPTEIDEDDSSSRIRYLEKKYL